MAWLPSRLSVRSKKEIMQIKEELSNVCMVQEAGLNVVAGGLDGLSIVATTAGVWAR